MRVRRIAAALAVALVAGGIGALPASAAGSDSFAGRTALDVPATVSGSNSGATNESGEPQPSCAPAGASVWLTFTPAADGPVKVFTGGGLDTVLAVYTGDALSNLVQVACNDDSGTRSSAVTIDAIAGTAYAVQVSGWRDGLLGPSQGSFSLSTAIPSEEAPVDITGNDHRADAADVSGVDVSVTSTLIGSTIEEGEPMQCQYGGYEYSYNDIDGSVWFRFTAPRDGMLSSSLDTYHAFEIFTSNPFDSLVTERCSTTQSNLLQLAAGDSILIRVAHRTSGYVDAGEFRLNLQLLAPPVNDAFADAVHLDGIGASGSVTFRAASYEPGEPGLDWSNGTVWWRFTTPVAEDVVLTTAGSDFRTALAVFTGPSVDRLWRVAGNTSAATVSSQSSVGFRAQAGETYWVQAGGYSYYSSRTNLEIRALRGKTVTVGQYAGVITAGDGEHTQTGVGVLGEGVVVNDGPDGTTADACVGLCVDDFVIPEPVAGLHP